MSEMAVAAAVDDKRIGGSGHSQSCLQVLPLSIETTRGSGYSHSCFYKVENAPGQIFSFSLWKEALKRIGAQ
jgi:hypothetical protein